MVVVVAAGVDTTMSQHTSAGISPTAPEGLLPLSDNPQPGYQTVCGPQRAAGQKASLVC